jgi:hypothetical protein
LFARLAGPSAAFDFAAAAALGVDCGFSAWFGVVAGGDLEGTPDDFLAGTAAYVTGFLVMEALFLPGELEACCAGAWTFPFDEAFVALGFTGRSESGGLDKGCAPVLVCEGAVAVGGWSARAAAVASEAVE